MNPNHSMPSNFRVSKSIGGHTFGTVSYLSSIKFDTENETLILKGNITQKDLHNFYFPMKSQISLHLAKGKSLIIGIFLSDLNFNNVKMLFELFGFLKKNASEGSKIKVKWFVSPFDMSILEIAQDFEQLFKIGAKTVLTRV